MNSGISLRSSLAPFAGMVVLALLFPFVSVHAVVSNSVRGRIILQVERNGEAWYVNPSTLKRYYLGRPSDAFKVMQDQGVGITNNDLKRFKVGFTGDVSSGDRDQDGLSDIMEEAVGTDPDKADTDGDGYNDAQELAFGYNPAGPGAMPIDAAFARQNEGRIFLQVESHGEAWYIEPGTDLRFFLGRPNDAFSVMRKRGLGISEVDISTIAIGEGDVPKGEESAADSAPASLVARIISARESVYLENVDMTYSYRQGENPQITFDVLGAKADLLDQQKQSLLNTGYSEGDVTSLLASFDAFAQERIVGQDTVCTLDGEEFSTAEVNDMFDQIEALTALVSYTTYGRFVGCERYYRGERAAACPLRGHISSGFARLKEDGNEYAPRVFGYSGDGSALRWETDDASAAYPTKEYGAPFTPDVYEAGVLIKVPKQGKETPMGANITVSDPAGGEDCRISMYVKGE